MTTARTDQVPSILPYAPSIVAQVFAQQVRRETDLQAAWSRSPHSHASGHVPPEVPARVEVRLKLSILLADPQLHVGVTVSVGVEVERERRAMAAVQLFAAPTFGRPKAMPYATRTFTVALGEPPEVHVVAIGTGAGTLTEGLLVTIPEALHVGSGRDGAESHRDSKHEGEPLHTPRIDPAPGLPRLKPPT